MFRAYEPAGANRDRLVAIKVFRLDLTPEQAAALVAELNALVASDLTHPHIAAPIAAGLEHGTAYLAQEYAVGESLDVVLRENGPMSIAGGVGLVEALAGALDFAADRGVRHGSLHLRDILVGSDGPRVTGFGISQALTKIGAKRPTRPQYSLPDGPSDVYSLGAIAFEAITGKRASQDNLADFEQQHGVELRSAFDVALNSNPELRPERAGDFAEVVRDAAEMTAEAERNSIASESTVTPPAVTSTDPIDLDLHVEAPMPEVEVRREDPVNALKEVDLPPPFPVNWSAQPPRALQSEVPAEPETRRWPIVVSFLAFAVVAAFAVSFLLQSRGNVPAGEPDAAVQETTVDVPRTPPPVAAPEPPPAKSTQGVREPAPSAAPPAPVPSRPASGAVRRTQTGSLLVRTAPSDADILVNGRAHGKTPLVLRDLALGSYTIRIAHDGYAIEERTLQLTSQRPVFSTTINLRAAPAPPTARGGPEEKSGPGGLNVQSRPSGARGYVNDRLVGSTPVTIPDVPAGTASVRIELDGYETWTTTARVGAGDETRVAASLERKQGQ